MSARDLEARLGADARPDGVAGTLRAWRATRLPWQRFLPLAMLSAWAANVAAPVRPSVIVFDVVLAYCLIAQLRLWDDLADRERDRRLHQDRVLVRCADVRPIVVACVLGGAACALALFAWRGPQAALCYGALCLGLAAWYRLHAARAAVHAHVLLLKYPAIALLLASSAAPGWVLVCTATGLYVAMCAFELVDRYGAQPRAARLLLGFHAAIAGLVALGMRVDVFGIAMAALATLSILAAGGAVGALPGRRYLPFLATVAVLVRFSIGGST